MSMVRFLTTLLAILCPLSAGAITLAPRDIIVLDGLLDAVFRVDPITGDRTIFSSASVGTGPGIEQALGIAVEPGGTVLVSGTSDFITGWIYRIDPATGNRSVVSSAAVGAGAALVNPQDLVVSPTGEIYVADGQVDALFRVDPMSGNRTVVTSSTIGSGPVADNLLDLVLGSDMDAFVIDSNAVFRVDLLSGDRELVSAVSFPSVGTIGSGPSFNFLNGVAITNEGTLVAVDRILNTIFGVDPLTGNRTIISNNAINAGTGLANPLDIAVDADGDLLVVNQTSMALVRVDPLTGGGAFVSIGGSVGSGPGFGEPSRVAIVPVPESSTASLWLVGILILRMAHLGGVPKRLRSSQRARSVT